MKYVDKIVFAIIDVVVIPSAMLVMAIGKSTGRYQATHSPGWSYTDNQVAWGTSTLSLLFWSAVAAIVVGKSFGVV